MSWSLFLDQTYTLTPSPAVGDTRIQIDGLTGGQLAVKATNSLARLSWKLAGRLTFEQSISGIPTPAESFIASTSAHRIKLGANHLVEVPPNLKPPYRICFSVPYWHTQMRLEIWQAPPAEQDVFAWAAIQQGLSESDVILYPASTDAIALRTAGTEWVRDQGAFRIVSTGVYLVSLSASFYNPDLPFDFFVSINGSTELVGASPLAQTLLLKEGDLIVPQVFGFPGGDSIYFVGNFALFKIA